MAQDLTAALTVIDLASVAVFAVTGALVASRKQMDIVAFMWLGTVTGIGGGTVRDLLLGLPVFWVRQPVYVGVSLLAAIAVYFTAHLIYAGWSRYRVVLWLDAVGLALVSVAGAAKGLDAGAGPLVAIVMGVITAAFGGIIRDILGQEPSILLRREVYVTAAVAGALAYTESVGLVLERDLAATLGFCAGFGVRSFAILFKWALPAYRPRPGRGMDEVG